MRTRTFITTDYSTLESLCQKHYGFDPEIACNLECSNDTWLVRTVGEPGKYDYEDIDKIRAGKVAGYATLSALLLALHMDGHIEAGDYLVEISW